LGPKPSGLIDRLMKPMGDDYQSVHSLMGMRVRVYSRFILL